MQSIEISHAFQAAFQALLTIDEICWYIGMRLLKVIGILPRDYFTVLKPKL
jgi:hypothetical protein